jgi:hypothetical protein
VPSFALDWITGSRLRFFVVLWQMLGWWHAICHVCIVQKEGYWWWCAPYWNMHNWVFLHQLTKQFLIKIYKYRSFTLIS